jgi:glycosyltransferase involved in cell wall biosynthesis
MRYVLLIPGWFPSNVNFLAGDFIERHARAASVYFPVKVLFVVKDESLPPGTIKLEHEQVSDLYEAYTYYYSSAHKIKAIEKFRSVRMQSKCLYDGYRKITSKYGNPSLIHAHVLVKHAWFALLKSRKDKIPLLASEQWTGFLQAAEHEFNSLSSFQKRYIRKTFKNAIHVTTVSEILAKQIRSRFQLRDHTVIPNLVDTSIFLPLERSNTAVTNFIHISTLSSQKNFDEIIAACKLLKQSTNNFHLRVVAPLNLHYKHKVEAEQLDEHISFHAEVPQTKIRELVASSDALILYSNYETFGCVIVEANACGVPVITSDFPVFDENVQEGITGFKVPLHHRELLADRMLKIVNGQHSFNKQEIVHITKEKYSAEVIGKQFAEVYNRYAKP